MSARRFHDRLIAALPAAGLTGEHYLVMAGHSPSKTGVTALMLGHLAYKGTASPIGVTGTSPVTTRE